MADLLNVLGHRELTGTVNKLKFPELMFAGKVPRRTINGDVAEWTIRKPNVSVHNYFVGRSGTAMPVRVGDYAKRTFGIPYRFASVTFDAGVLNQLDVPGTDVYDEGMTYVDSEVRDMTYRVREYTNEFLIAQAIQGSLTINFGDGATSNSLTVDYEIPAGNQLTATTAWTSATANILEDVRRAKNVVEKFGGMPARFCCNDYTANLIHTNTTLQNYFKEYGAGQQLIETGNLPPLLGLQPEVVSTRYADTNQTDSFEKKLIPDGKVIIHPNWPGGPGDWIEMQAARFLIPDTLQGGLVRSQDGAAMWSRTTDNPPGLTVFGRFCEFPVIRQPWLIAILTVT